MLKPLVAILMSASSLAIAEHGPRTIEETEVFANRLASDNATIQASEHFAIDTATLLKKMPGANLNSNGGLTGIAQYRGMFGDRVAVKLDGSSLISGGPNAMDTPLSYASPLLTETLSIERGIPSVSASAESIGGQINATTHRGSFSNDKTFELSGALSSRYNVNGDINNNALRLTEANNSHKFTLLGATDRGDDIKTPAGDIQPSKLSRNRYDASYAYQNEHSNALAYIGKVDTDNSGTAALPMDIVTIDTDLYGTQWNQQINDKLNIDAKLSYNDVEHRMDNFSLRTSPASGMAYRQNYATGSGGNARLTAKTTIYNSDFTFGFDGKIADHDSLITNPNNTSFSIVNFNDVERDLQGLFLQFDSRTQHSSWQAGIRYNHIATDAGDVAVNGMMNMMAMNANLLANNFNASDRNLEFNNIDAVLKYSHALSNTLHFTADIGSKTRAPSYQELYLWLPMQSTGGLADGRSYIGNLDLDSERSKEINLGLDWQSKYLQLSPQLFYKEIDDYIQGITSTNIIANNVANMMGGANALEFANVEAKIYGLDLAWNYTINDHFFVDGVASYLRGKRRDINDNLYRLAPPNALIALNYVYSHGSTAFEAISYMKQSNVSRYNQETKTAGYSVFNLLSQWNINKALHLEGRIDNIFNKRYQEHLAGINRVTGADIPLGSRLYGAERSYSIGVNYHF